MNKTVLLIMGMRANSCREQIAGALELIPGVKQVDVSLFRARVTIVHDPSCNAADLVRVIQNAGYKAEPAI